MRFLTIIFLYLFFTSGYLMGRSVSTTATVQEYILAYDDIALKESIRSGIPASIILAQGILESGFGNSDLCLESNNHFGVKWKNPSDGEYVCSMDDDYDAKGNHIASKFIKYSSAVESFRHHSDLIMTKEHYKPLFKYSRTDYTNWAIGLRKCGYSTDSEYGTLLIDLIQKYKLYQFDIPIIKDYTNVPNSEVGVIKVIEKKMTFYPFIFVKTSGQILEENIRLGKERITEVYKADVKHHSHTPTLPYTPQYILLLDNQDVITEGTDEKLMDQVKVNLATCFTYYVDTDHQLHTVHELFVRGNST